MPRNLDIALLRAFVAVADRKSMTAAGRLLHLTQGAISQQIARLEIQTGPLFVRDHRGMRLSAGGERLLGPSRHLLSVHDALWQEMNGGAIAGSVRLGAPQDLVASKLGPILKDFSTDHPHVELTLVCAASTELMRALERGEIDIALVEEMPGQSNGECLAADRLVWVGATGGTAFGKDVLPVSMVDRTCAFRPVVLDALRRCGRSWRTVFENGSIDAAAATVRADLAVTVLLSSTVPPGFDVLPTGRGLPELPIFAINLHALPGQPSLAVAQMRRFLRDGFAPRADGETVPGQGQPQTMPVSRPRKAPPA
ncbi:MAG: LysR family transcriptional regulator [Burkholderiales bacterium]|nr:LysR family transcriptional regulator [Burkholderiales bacterium]MDE2287894.1 LysR family transcriptional regulator [Burkholderiales bacterium]MDE2609773.1 LysR family transcriptional regulator [Burkholderiales bacterium]